MTVKVLFFYYFIFSLFDIHSLEKSYEAMNVFKMEYNTNIKIVKTEEVLLEQNKDKFIVWIDLDLINNKETIRMNIYLKPKKNVAGNKIIEKYKLKKILANANFGVIGENAENKFMNEFGSKFKNKNKIEVKKYISTDGYEDISNIVVYYFKIKNNQYFDECKIGFFNVWDEKLWEKT